MTYDVGPRGAAFRNVIKPIYRSIQLPLARGIDRLLNIRTTPTTDVAPIERIPSRPLGWMHAIRLLRRHPLHSEDTVIDIGCGAGRILVIASRFFNCRRVLGIELDEQLYETALNNVRDCRLRARSPVEVVNADASNRDVADDVSVVFFNRPFGGEPFQRFVDRLLESVDRSPRVVRFIFGNPKEHEYLIGTKRFELIDVVRSWRPRPEWEVATSINVYRLT